MKILIALKSFSGIFANYFNSLNCHTYWQDYTANFLFSGILYYTFGNKHGNYTRFIIFDGNGLNNMVV
jgi:hypothetical protein